MPQYVFSHIKMITKTNILKNLNQLDVAFRKAKSQKHSLYFSKLAILELCGWIELSMDDIIECHCNRKIKLKDNRKFVKQDVVRRTYGFDYEKNFRKMLINLIGIVGCEKIESKLPPSIHARLVADLDALKRARDSLAHTYLKGAVATIHIDAPSVTKARFTTIYDGLIEIEKGLRAL